MKTEITKGQILTSDGSEAQYCDLRIRSRVSVAVYAALIWFGAWIFAAISIFIPIAHFVTVPGGFIAGPVAAILIYRRRAGMFEILANSAQCPRCRGTLVFFWRQVDPHYEGTCSHCHVAYRVSHLKTPH